MTRKQLFLLMVFVSIVPLLIAAVTLTHIVKINVNNDKRLSLKTPNSSITVTPTPTPNQDNNKFFIVPNGYIPTKQEIELIKTTQVTNIIIENSTANYQNELKALLSDNSAADVSLNDYTICSKNNSAESLDSANGMPDASIYLCKALEATVHKNIVIEKINCDIKQSKCINETLSRIVNKSSDLLLYTPQYPILSLLSLNDITIDTPHDTYIFSWGKSDIYTLNSYSVEVLDKVNKRVFASGRINTATEGDYFIPTSTLSAQELTVKVRLWITFNGKQFTEPAIISKTFTYTPAITTITNVTSIAKQISWIPDWGMADGIDSIKKNPKKWDTISPVWFVPNKNGTLERKPTLNSTVLVSLLRKNNIKLVPTISTFDADILKDILRNNLDKHVSEIVKVAVQYNYDGIDLDYESTYSDDKDLLITFLTKLSSELHNKGKTLSFTALPKIDNRPIYGFLPQTHQAQDWKAIGSIVDEFRIMAYDFTGQGSLQPGPLSPVQWNETLIRYAITQMDGSKVVLGLPLYSHGWPKPKLQNLAGVNNDKSLSSGELKNTISLQHDSIAYVKSHSSYYRESYDGWNKEVRAEFKYNGVERVMYYLDKKAINERINLAQKYGIKGVCYWRIGGEQL